MLGTNGKLKGNLEMRPLSAADRRQSERLEIGNLRVRVKDTGELVGRIVNLSFGGMLVNSATPFEPDLSYLFRIPLEEAYQGHYYLEVEAECVWCTNAVNPAIYSVGFMFPPNSADHIPFIEHINARYRRH